MKWILVSASLLGLCVSQSLTKVSSPVAVATISTIRNERQVVQDTVLEKNHPDSLDLTRHQLFIDTTRSSVFYNRIEKWAASRFDSRAIIATLNDINSDFKPSSVDIKDFPTHFVTLHRLNNELVLYDRCDGISRRFELCDTAFFIYGPLESEAESIAKLVHLSDDKLQLELQMHPAKTGTRRAFLTIERCSNSTYRLKHGNETFSWTEDLTTPDHIREFDLVVNHCPTMKMREFTGFDSE